MPDRAAVLEAAIAKNREYLANTGGIGYAEKIIRYQNELNAINAAKDAQIAAEDAAEWSGSWDAAYERWLDAADEVLQAQGKPYGRDGAERGSMTRKESIELAERIGVADELAGLWGPDTPGAST